MGSQPVLPPYTWGVSSIALAALGLVIGYKTRRWVVVLIGPAAGAGVLGLTAWTQQNTLDSPASFVGVVASLAAVAGVALGRAAKKEPAPEHL